MTKTDLIHKALDHYGFICLPEIQSLPDLTGVVPVIKILQKPALIKFDSCERVSREGSIVDFVIRKGSQELLVGVWPNGYKLTEQQEEAISNAGRSYIAILGEWVERESVKQALESGSVSVNPEGLEEFNSQLIVTYWVYHARHGWYYDKALRV